MYGSPRFFALLGIVAVSGCAGGASTAPSMPFVPQSVQRSTPAAAAQGTVFIAVTSTNAIESFPAGVANPKPQVALRAGINRPTSITVGGSGTLFVTNTGNNTITEYAPGETKPNFTFSFPSTTYTSIAAGTDDTLYATDENGNVDVFPLHATQPSAILPNPGGGGPGYGLGAMAVDSNNDIFVVGFGGACCGTGVFEYPGAGQNSIALQSTYNMGGGVAVDGLGDLLTSPGNTLIKGFLHVVDLSSGKATNFRSPKIAQMSFDAKDHYAYTTYGTVSIVNFKTKKVVATLPRIYDAYGVAVRPAVF